MSFFRKKTEPVVQWVTDLPGLMESYPIIPARQALPEWFKASDTRVPKAAAHSNGPANQPARPKPTWPVKGPKTYWRDDTPTIRHCPGVVDVMRSGYLLRAWTDIEVTTPEPPREGKVREDGQPDRFMSVTAMNPQEVGGRIGAFGASLNQKLPLHPGEYEFALKFDTPWVCKTPPGYSLLYAPIPYDEHRPYRVLHGITDNDDFHVVNLLLMWGFHGSYLVEAGTPLCWLLPVKREGFNLPTEVSYDPELTKQLRVVGKGGPGSGAGRLINNAYLLERAKARKARGE